MRTLRGKVSSRFGVAGGNLATVEGLVLARTKLVKMARGTLNVTVSDDYIVHPDWTIEPHEYFSGERLKLQRCRVRGHRMVIMRPEPHEWVGGIGANVLELISPIPLRTDWGLVDGDYLDVVVDGDDAWWAEPEPDL